MEPLTSELVAEVLTELLTAFPKHDGMRNNPGATCDLYRNNLHGISGDALRAAAKRSIQEDRYFPKVSELRTYATEWQRRNQATATPFYAPTSTRCGRCGQIPSERSRWRPMAEPKMQYRVYVTEDGTAVLLEEYKRFLCDCAAPCTYRPDPEYREPAMRLTTYDKARALPAYIRPPKAQAAA